MWPKSPGGSGFEGKSHRAHKLGPREEMNLTEAWVELVALMALDVPAPSDNNEQSSPIAFSLRKEAQIAPAAQEIGACFNSGEPCHANDLLGGMSCDLVWVQITTSCRAVLIDCREQPGMPAEIVSACCCPRLVRLLSEPILLRQARRSMAARRCASLHRSLARSRKI